MITAKQTQSGFALLLTLIVVSVVLAIGLSLLDITLKQFLLSGTARDSEVSFHAAYAGAECVQYYRIQDLAANFIGSQFSLLADCLPDTDAGEYSHNYTALNPDSGPAGSVHYSTYQITWGPDSDRCTEMDVYVFDASAGEVTYNVAVYGDSSEVCAAGATCSVILSRGYNRGCSNLSSLRTIQREVVAEF